MVMINKVLGCTLRLFHTVQVVWRGAEVLMSEVPCVARRGKMCPQRSF